MALLRMMHASRRLKLGFPSKWALSRVKLAVHLGYTPRRKVAAKVAELVQQGSAESAVQVRVQPLRSRRSVSANRTLRSALSVPFTYAGANPEKFSRVFFFWEKYCVDEKLQHELASPELASLRTRGYGCFRNRTSKLAGSRAVDVAGTLAQEAFFMRECMQQTTGAAHALANLTGILST